MALFRGKSKGRWYRLRALKCQLSLWGFTGDCWFAFVQSLVLFWTNTGKAQTAPSQTEN